MKNIKPIEKIYLGNEDPIFMIEIFKTESEMETYTWNIIFLHNRRKIQFSWKNCKENNLGINWDHYVNNFKMIGNDLNYNSIEDAKDGAINFIIDNFISLNKIENFYEELNFKMNYENYEDAVEEVPEDFRF